MSIPVTVNCMLPLTIPTKLLASHMYKLLSVDLKSGTVNVLLLIPVTLLGNCPDPIVQ